MKNIILFTIFILGISFSVKAQSPRMQLIEEFGGEGDLKTVYQEKSLHQLIFNSNPANTILLNYVINSNSCSRCYLSWISVSAANRYSYNYYKNLKTPYGLQDGKAFLNSGGIDTGNLSYLKQTALNTRATTLSPFSIQLTHRYNTNFDSAFVTVIIKSTQAYQAIDSTKGKIRFQLALIETEIAEKNPTYFISSSQTHYRNVVKDLVEVPLKSNWNIGEVDTFRINYYLRNYPLKFIADYSKIAFVSFIQDEGYQSSTSNYSVLQAVYSPPLQVTLPDAGIINATSIDNHCADSITPKYIVKNYGNTIINSLKIISIKSNSSNDTSIWTGLLHHNDSTIITFPTVEIKRGLYSLTGIINEVNGNTIAFSKYYGIYYGQANNLDYNGSNNISNSQLTTFYKIKDIPVSYLINCNFDNTPFRGIYYSNSNYSIFKTDHSICNNQYDLGGFGKSKTSVGFTLAESYYCSKGLNRGISGEKKALIFDNITLSNKFNLGLSFNYAYARYDNQSYDTLQISISLNCGATWQPIYTNSGAALATAPNDSIKYFLPDSTQWKNELIDLRVYDNQPQVMIKFEVVNRGGNTLFIDDINLKNNLISEVNNQVFNLEALKISPNPCTDELVIHISEMKIEKIEVVNILGQLQSCAIKPSNNSEIKLDVSKLNAQIYFLKLTDDKGLVHQTKFAKQ